MRHSLRISAIMGAWFLMLALGGMVQAQWSQAVLEPVTSGPENDHLGYSSLALDDAGTLHLLYDRWMGGSDHDFYYKVKPLGGSWTYNVPIGDLTASLLSPSVAVITKLPGARRPVSGATAVLSAGNHILIVPAGHVTAGVPVGAVTAPSGIEMQACLIVMLVGPLTAASARQPTATTRKTAASIGNA